MVTMTDYLADIGRLAEAALVRYDLSPSATATLINHSENATYRIDDPDRGERAIRIGAHLLAQQRGGLGALDASGIRFELAGEDAEQGRLACTVLTEEADAVAWADAQREVGEHAAIAKGDADGIGTQHGGRGIGVSQGG